MSSHLFQGDCLDLLPQIPNQSMDLILTDPPYGTTACKWDSIIPLEPMWKQLKRIAKPSAPIVLTSSQPYTAVLIASQLKLFKYSWVWDKKIPSGMSYARFQPMRQHEDVLVFCEGKTKYNPQKTKREKPIKAGGMGKSPSAMTQSYKPLKKTYHEKNPTTILTFDKVRRGSVHPTQKPVALMEYLVKTYTDPSDWVLDFTMGSGTTGVACRNLDRNFVGIELDLEYFTIAKERIDNG